ncbi:MAG: hypothetical protein PHZ02_17390 [Desulfocapsaceae bacterium]|nr:hypothetical protein [Desulfocapsaceae bacterium]
MHQGCFEKSFLELVSFVERGIITLMQADFKNKAIPMLCKESGFKEAHYEDGVLYLFHDNYSQEFFMKIKDYGRSYGIVELKMMNSK